MSAPSPPKAAAKGVKPIEARDQVSLGPGKGFRLALTSMSYRMFRSSVTVAILALAVAFLVHTVTHGILAQETERSAWEELRVDRELGERITRLVGADSEATIYGQLHSGGPARIDEYLEWSGLDASEFDAARGTARELHQLGKTLTDLPLAAQAVLLSDSTPAELFARLDTSEAVAAFSDNLDRLKVHLPGTDRQSLKRLLLEERPQLTRAIERIARGHERAIGEVAAAYRGRAPAELAIEQPGDFAATLRGVGFSVDTARLSALKAFAQEEADTERIRKVLLDSGVRATVARQTRLAPGDVDFDALLEHIEAETEAAGLISAMRAADPAFGLDTRRILSLLERARRERRLLGVASEPVAASGGVFGLSEKNQWLIALSLLVCVVGVANAMLMSVTERFTEIATMKCLGAMDRFVMMMFVFEAVVQGLVGGAIGVGVGVLLAVLRGLVEFGALFGAGFGAAGDLVLGISSSLSVGVVLAAVAAVGPSWIAARLPPMEAMRVD